MIQGVAGLHQPVPNMAMMAMAYGKLKHTQRLLLFVVYLRPTAVQLSCKHHCLSESSKWQS